MFEVPILVSISENDSLETKINRHINLCVNRSWWLIVFSTEVKLWTLSWRNMSIINLESLLHSLSYYVRKYVANTLCEQGFIQLPLFYRINSGRQYKLLKQNTAEQTKDMNSWVQFSLLLYSREREADWIFIQVSAKSSMH